ncbi:MAG: glycosyltransferase family 2 protein [bacterium]|nr:glycosyltransferase family 2 protein [bacterium]
MTEEPRPRPIPELSAAIITYNEADRIGACLESLAPVCSEILVLDSNSTDGTREICESYANVRFIAQAFEGYAKQKNRALEYTNTPWVLCLDADELLAPGAAADIRRFLTAPVPDEITGARMRRRTYHMGAYIEHGGWTHYRYRLVRRERAEWRGVGGMPLHELLYPTEDFGESWNRRNGVTLKGDIIHNSKSDLSNQVDTINVYSSIYAGARHRQQVAHGRSHSHRKPLYLLRMLFKPPLKFIEIYFAKAGFLDGYRGLIIACSSSFATFLRWAKLYELANTEVREASNLPQFLREQNGGSRK